MIYIVLGMHKSGTTLLAKTLHRSGIRMVEQESGESYYEGNKFERKETSLLIQTAFGQNEASYLLPSLGADLLEELKSDFNKLMCKKEETGVDWGFKDPRFTLLYQKIFDDPSAVPHKLICIYREIGQVVGHYLRYQYNFLHKVGIMPKVLSSWCVYNETLCSILENGSVDSLLLKFEEIRHDSEYFKMNRVLDSHHLVDCRTEVTRKFQGTPPISSMVFDWIENFFLIIYKIRIQQICDRLEALRYGTKMPDVFR